jgi:hypothetical protein
MTFKDKIHKIFGSGIENYREILDSNEIIFELNRTEFNAEKLFELSDALGTGTISIETDVRTSGYCDTCSYEYGVMILTVKEVKF